MKSNLFPEELQRELQNTAPLYSQDGKRNETVVYHHFFLGNIDFYITEGNEENDDFTFFGVTSIYEPEMGYISLKEIESITVKQRVEDPDGNHIADIPLKIERDEYFTPTKAVNIDKIKHLFI